MAVQTTPPWPLLPPEVAEMVLDSLRGDSKTLLVCSAVCRAWFLRARYNLFYEVELRTDNVEAFFAAVVRDPYVATFIRELTLVGLWRPPLTPPDFLWTTNMRTLRMHYIDIGDNWLRVFHGARSITELSLQNCSTVDIDALLEFLQGKPKLKHLALSNLRINARSMQVDMGHATLPPLRSLCLSGHRGSATRVMETFSSIPEGLSSLSVLKIELCTRELARFNTALSSMARSLRELHLTVEPEPTPPDISVSPLSLRICRQLTVFSLGVRLRHPKQERQRHLAWVVHLFSTLHGESLRAVKITVRATGATAADLPNFDLHGVGGVLMQGRFAALRRVAVRVVKGGRDIRRSVDPYVREQLASFDRRGILRCAGGV